jgi:hypothetical protein
MPELADIFRAHGPEYIAKFKDRMPTRHLDVIRDVVSCRTEALGGQLYHCPQCDDLHYRYHSCKNRHCPKCQNDTTNTWLEKQMNLLLPVSYFMATFTLPQSLRALARSNQGLIYNMLFKASSYALQKIAADPKYIGGLLGMVGVLQTWRRDLGYHVHVHYLIPGGGLSPDRKKWYPARYDYLVPEKAVAKIFRGKFRDLLKKADLFDQVSSETWSRLWVVDIIDVGSGRAAMKYLAPYIFRVGITNNNIIRLEDGKVTFRYRDSGTDQYKTKMLEAQEFIRRFLQHALPHRFRKVRYYGFLSPTKRDLLEQIKKRLHISPTPKRQENSSLRDADSPRCPKCGSVLMWVREVPRKRGPPIWR